LETKLPAGTQTIEVEVLDSGGEKAVDTFSIKITAVEEESNFGMLLGIIVAVVVVVIVVLALMKMRGRSGISPEASMDLDSLEQDFSPATESTPDYGEEYNPMPQYSDDQYDRLQ
jgi:hypothetical protein